jgi:protein phosphatase
MRTVAGGATDPGLLRTNNEDAWLALEDAGLFAVADGVGGHAGGEVASGIAVETLREVVPDLLGAKDRTPPAGTGEGADRETAALRYALSLANRRLRETAERTPALSGMGTTLTVLLLAKGRALIAHIGDSRAYLLRSGTLQQLTRDHSLVAEQVQAGILTPEQARISAYRHVITRALGLYDEAAPDLQTQAVEPGDLFLLCSDGLTEMLDDRAISSVLASSSPGDAVRTLIDAANSAGGVDNITAIVVKVLEI